MTERCPCHSGEKYSNCCEKFHNGTSPKTALQLMRSRYSAYALCLPEYIMNTTDPDSPAYSSHRKRWRKTILTFCQSYEFTELTIHSWKEKSTQASVVFTASLTKADTAVEMKEHSLFTKRNNQWFYYHGTVSIKK